MKMRENKQFKWTPPDNWKDFFDASSDDEFKKKHPIGYVFFVLLGMTALFLPAIIFLFALRIDSAWMMLGMFGGLVFGVGLFNLVAIIIKQYLGHWVSIISFLIGGLMMLVSWSLCA